MSKNYEVGYGKPPKHGQFKKGRSGNPRGRPKGSKNLNTIFSDVLNQKVVIVENGKKRTIPYMEAFAKSMAAKGLNGTPRDRITIFRAIEEYCPEAVQDNVTTSIQVTYVEAKDGRPWYPEEAERSAKETDVSNDKAEDPDDDDWLN